MGELRSENTRLVYTSGEPVVNKYIYFDIPGDDNERFQVFKTDEDGNLLTSDNKNVKTKIIEGEYRGYITDSHLQEGADYIEGKELFTG